MVGQVRGNEVLMRYASPHNKASRPRMKWLSQQVPDKADFEKAYEELKGTELCEMYGITNTDIYALLYEWEIPLKSPKINPPRPDGIFRSENSRRQFGPVAASQQAVHVNVAQQEIDYDRLARAIVRQMARMILEGYTHS